ncbi:MAG TPA: HAMP domain-containing sensor histidine kinase [Acidimicrobiales bacterium]|nr:HAMP domain-containing sensor histidine kinase [Acidimicrobiales bacterium]
MSLRFRLVAGLVGLMTVGLGIFGVATYALYSRSQYHDLDQTLRASVPLVSGELARAAGVVLGPPGAGRPGRDGQGAGPRSGQAPLPGGAVSGGGPPPAGGVGAPVVAPGTYGELVDGTGTVRSHVQEVSSTSPPKLPRPLPSTSGGSRVLGVASVSGSGSWRVEIGAPQNGGYRVVVAVPTSSVTSALHRLTLIELSGAAALLLILSLGAGLVLRRGLAPIERMAGTARAIAGGDLTRRAEVPSSSSEVVELGRAFNTMLDEIQAAFGERDATEARLRQFLADASHELRTPLTSIQGFAELFRLGLEDPRVDKTTVARRIEEESARMKGLVEDLLLLARLDQVRAGDRAEVDVAVLAADACSDAIAAEPGRPVTLAAPEPVVVLGDEQHLRQALGNLVGNALRHTPAGSPIEVSAVVDAGWAVVEVRDHGPGLDEEARAHVFERFWQRDPARSGAGAGLGLAIVAAVMTEHQGTVSAADAPGGGAVFRLRLPAVSG